MIRKRPPAGFSLIEVTIAIAVGAVVLAAVYAVVAATIKGDDKLRARVEMQLEAAEALRRISQLLKHSGPIDLNDNSRWDDGEWPVFVQDPGPGFPTTNYDFLNTAAKLNAPPGDPENPMTNPSIIPKASSTDPEGYFGSSVEIGFRLPRDNGSGMAGANDGDNFPTTPTGDIEWGRDAAGAPATEAVYYAIVLVPNLTEGSVYKAMLDTGNELQLREYNRDRMFLRKTVLAKGVERIVFEAQGAPIVTGQPGGTPSSSYSTDYYDSSLGSHQMRVSIWFWRLDADGTPVKMRNSSTVNFRSVQR